MQLLIGTDAGLYEMADSAPRLGRPGKVTHLAQGEGEAWAIIDDRIERLSSSAPGSIDLPGGLAPRCLLPTRAELLIGTSRAHLCRIAEGDGEAAVVDGFERAGGRDRWHTPWGGPPDTRSLARDADGGLYANVHVGGVLRSTDGREWQPTMDIAADVHQVGAHPTQAGCVAVASAWGLGLSLDGAASWNFTRDGLPSSYCRAVAVAGEMVFVSASDGPSGGRAAVYRRQLRGSGPLERCRSGPAEWFEGNIDSGCLVASGDLVAFGTASGSVHVSTDTGATWSEAAGDLPAVRALAVS